MKLNMYDAVREKNSDDNLVVITEMKKETFPKKLVLFSK